ncbi:MAG: CTP synthase, partial [Rhodothermales bacterium]
IKHWMLKLGETGDYDVVITEIGGTVGDIESQPYLEAIRQLRYEVGSRNTLDIHLTLVPWLEAAGELKTKPTQHSVKTLLSYGLQPDILVCRSERALDHDLRRKIALFCNVEARAVVQSLDAESIYEVPLLLEEQGLDDIVLEKLSIPTDLQERSVETPALDEWIRFLKRLKNPESNVRIALVGKYVEHQDAYKSINESFIIAGAASGVQVDVLHVHSDGLTADNVEEMLADIAGVLIAPGFGERGIAGKVEAVRYARERDIPFFGICLGMQCAVVEYARNVCGWEDANSTEFDPESQHPVIDIMEEQKRISDKGGTMRLGSYECSITPGSRVHEVYGTETTVERHRHRYEVNNVLRYKLLEHGMQFTGINPGRDLVEIVELPEKRWFIGVQFHPEYRSTVGHPHPLFRSFVEACIAYARGRDLIEQPRPPKRRKPAKLASAKV